MVYGVRRFGIFGYFANQIPAMDLPLIMAVFLKPLVFLIELLGLLIKHSILSIRLLANMVAGHIVLLSIMALAFSLEGASSSAWPLTAVISIVGSTLLSCLELFVAFLQAYVFTFLSAMFIGAAIHQH
jgi:F-type H+-transporting ATPase subunit a